MAKKKVFDDPLHGIDPVLKDAFSGEGFEVSPEPKVKKKGPAAPSFSLDTASPEVASFSGPAVADVAFPVLTPSPNTGGQKLEEDVFSRIPVTVSVELGRCQVSLKDVLELSDGAIVELDRLVGEPLDLVVNGQVIAQGEVVAVDNNYGLRITAIKSAPNT